MWSKMGHVSFQSLIPKFEHQFTSIWTLRVGQWMAGVPDIPRFFVQAVHPDRAPPEVRKETADMVINLQSTGC